MKKLQLSIFVVLLGLLVFGVHNAAADVVDETKMKVAQFQYEESYPLIATYTGDSGIVFNSYSASWSTGKLQTLENELLQNKHGEEIYLLKEINIFPDFPAGESVLGQYFALYASFNGQMRLAPEREINLYGGELFTTVNEFAQTLSHEYGHHFTYYHMIEGEGIHPDDWLTTDYVTSRDLHQYSSVHVDGSGEYEWLLPEILAEDYVQLFGSEVAIKDNAQRNSILPTPFDNEKAQQYWADMLGGNYVPQEPLSLFLMDYQDNSSYYNFWDLEFYVPSLPEGNAYITGQIADGFYQSVNVLTFNNALGSRGWITVDDLTDEDSFILFNAAPQFDAVNFRVTSYQENGFNLGSKTLRVNYQNVSESVTSDNELNLANKLSVTEKKQILTEVARANSIPPAVLKAIAYNETGMKQFNEDGTPVMNANGDGGIGMMQVTLADAEASGYDSEKLKLDTRYNIEVGAKILKEKWNYSFIPSINEKNPNVLENWYFAIMAYNGLSKVNDPAFSADTYQENVYETIKDLALMETKTVPSFVVEYPYPDKPSIMVFPSDKRSYSWPELNTPATQLYNIGDTVYSYNDQLTYSKLRESVSGDIIKNLAHYTPLEIIGGPYESDVPSSLFVYYKVKGNGFSGYISSSNVRKGNVTVFPDVKRAEVASAVAYLEMKKVIYGYTDGTFKPNQQLLRRHAAAFLVRELGLELPEGYVMKADDMTKGATGYGDMLIAEAHGLIGKGGKLRPNEPLTRAQMASILTRAYDQYYAASATETKFTDIDESFWNYADINRLANNNITVVSAYRPGDNVTRSQMALFLYRTLQLKQ